MTVGVFEKMFNELEGTESFDPIRFAVIQSLCERLEKPEHKGNGVLIEKAQSSIEEYQADLQRCKVNASLIVEQIKQHFPESFAFAADLFERFEFQQLERLDLQLKRKKETQKSQSGLNELNDIIGKQRAVVQESANAHQSLDEILHKQEQSARVEAGCAQLKVNDSHSSHFELQSMKGYRESKKYFNIDKVIARAINDFPENAGPHNPHMLAIKSLMHMQDLSPQYLRRFAGYTETILFLEKNSVKLNRKKTP